MPVELLRARSPWSFSRSELQILEEDVLHHEPQQESDDAIENLRESGRHHRVGEGLCTTHQEGVRPADPSPKDEDGNTVPSMLPRHKSDSEHHEESHDHGLHGETIASVAREHELRSGGRDGAQILHTPRQHPRYPSGQNYQADNAK